MKLEYLTIMILSLMMAGSIAMNSAYTSGAQFLSDFIFAFVVILFISRVLHLIKKRFYKGGELTNGS